MLPQTLQFLTEIDDWEDKYLAIMDLGQDLIPLTNQQKNADNKVVGCQSRVWLDIALENDKLKICGEADSRLVQGLVAVIIEIYQNKTKEEAIALGDSWLIELEFDANLSMIRRNGMNAMMTRIQQFCQQFCQ